MLIREREKIPREEGPMKTQGFRRGEWRGYKPRIAEDSGPHQELDRQRALLPASPQEEHC